KNFITKAIWQKVFSPKNSARHFSVDHDYVLIYAKNQTIWQPNSLPRTDKQNKAYSNPDNDPRGSWMSDNLTARNPYSLGIYSVTTPSGRIIKGPPPGTYWRVSEKKLKEMDADNRIWWGKDGAGVPRQKRFLSEVKDGRVPQTFWPYAEVGHTQEAKKETVALLKEDVFDTP
ncbi:site-specific DNA-methyltransferase, partial [Acinetobacter towneri]|nr:site-specific DNA-methyltransferase [Acinetobacter towneri]